MQILLKSVLHTNRFRRLLLLLSISIIGLFLHASPALSQTPILIDFEGLEPGTNVEEVTVNGLTVSIEATGGINQAWVFDSSAPTGGDEDLGTPNQNCTPAGPGEGTGGVPGSPGENCVALGNVLIIQENDNGIPDDASTGGTLTFTFSEPVIVNYFDLLDFEETTTPSIIFYDENDQQLGTPISPTGLGDNSYEQFDPKVDAGVFEVVTKILMDLPISGAVGGIEVMRASEVINMGRIGDTIFCQDTGEPLANVLVTLTSADGTLQTQNTDENGLYLFENLPLGSYTVSVDPETISGSCNIPAIDPDGNLDNSSSVTLTVDAIINLDQDFGYAQPAVDPLGSIGDTIFCVTTGEPLPNVLVTLTSDNIAPQTRNTDGNGIYLFDELPLGAYTVTVDPSTIMGDCNAPAVDPDGTLDNASSVTLTADAPDNLDQDFAYAAPVADPLGSIGDTIFCDANGNGLPDSGEGMANVTVRLSGPINTIATTETDGTYLFSELGAGDYTVRVDATTISATCNVPSVDPDASLDNTSTVSLGIGENNLEQDFGYVAPAPLLGSIGDTIFCDVNNNGLPDTGEGLANVVVTLTGDASGSMTTDATGIYLFQSLPVGNYTISVDTDTIPTSCNIPSVDPDDGEENRSSLALNAGEDNLDQDFGYVAPEVELGSIGDTIFCDANTNGTLDAGEGMADVIVTLSGTATASTTTQSDGSYLFENLEAGEYTVTVDPSSLAENCTVTSIDPDGGNDNLSTLTLAVGEDNRDQDFGYVTPTGPELFPRLTLEKVVANPVVARGDTLIYSIEYGNIGDADAEGVRLREGVPEGATFDAENSSPDWVCTGTEPGSICTLDIGTVPANTKGDPVQFAIKIDEDLPEDVTRISCVAAIESTTPNPTGVSSVPVSTEIVPGIPGSLESIVEPHEENLIFLPLFQ